MTFFDLEYLENLESRWRAVNLEVARVREQWSDRFNLLQIQLQPILTYLEQFDPDSESDDANAPRFCPICGEEITHVLSDDEYQISCTHCGVSCTVTFSPFRAVSRD